jgi:hypothetical protein
MKRPSTLFAICAAFIGCGTAPAYAQTLNTGVFAPGTHYGFLGVVTVAHGSGPDWSACASTTLGAYQLSTESYLSFDMLGGFSFTHSEADAGVDFAYNFAGMSLGRLLHSAKFNSVSLSGEVGVTALTLKGTKAGYGLVLAAKVQF